MTTTTFTDGVTPVVADWLNDVDAFVYEPAIYRDFNTAPGTVTSAKGRLFWDEAQDTLAIGHSADVSIPIEHTVTLPPCKNSTGALIPKGTFLMATGATGDLLQVAPAVTDGSVDFKWMVGFAIADIVIDSEVGHVMTGGTLLAVDTSAWAVGTVLYPDPLVAGGLTSTQPAAPNFKVAIGIVLRQHATQGRIYVRVTLPSNLGDTDANVEFTALANNDLIVYNSTTGLWTNSFGILDEDTMVSDSATDVPTQQSVKAYTYSGTWTPTLGGLSNITSATAQLSTYSKVGDLVTVSGAIDITFTATGTASLTMSLPIASNLTVISDANGIAITGDSALSRGSILGNVGDALLFDLESGVAGACWMTFMAQYRIKT